MEITKSIDYILDAVFARGFNYRPNECNDFFELLQKKDFKDLIAIELYECYFWEERHEFDLQLLKELVEGISNFLQNPDTIMQIKAGLLQNLPSAVIIAIVTHICGKMRKIKSQGRSTIIPEDENTSWSRIKMNTAKIDKEFANHDYILTDDIEKIFDTNREEILPLLKLCGCKCYIDKRRSIWFKAGTPLNQIRATLKKLEFKYKKIKESRNP